MAQEPSLMEMDPIFPESRMEGELEASNVADVDGAIHFVLKNLMSLDGDGDGYLTDSEFQELHKKFTDFGECDDASILHKFISSDHRVNYKDIEKRLRNQVSPRGFKDKLKYRSNADIMHTINTFWELYVGCNHLTPPQRKVSSPLIGERRQSAELLRVKVTPDKKRSRYAKRRQSAPVINSPAVSDQWPGEDVSGVSMEEDTFQTPMTYESAGPPARHRRGASSPLGPPKRLQFSSPATTPMSRPDAPFVTMRHKLNDFEDRLYGFNAAQDGVLTIEEFHQVVREAYPDDYRNLNLHELGGSAGKIDVRQGLSVLRNEITNKKSFRPPEEFPILMVESFAAAIRASETDNATRIEDTIKSLNDLRGNKNRLTAEMYDRKMGAHVDFLLSWIESAKPKVEGQDDLETQLEMARQNQQSHDDELQHQMRRSQLAMQENENLSRRIKELEAEVESRKRLNSENVHLAKELKKLTGIEKRFQALSEDRDRGREEIDNLQAEIERLNQPTLAQQLEDESNDPPPLPMPSRRVPFVDERSASLGREEMEFQVQNQAVDRSPSEPSYERDPYSLPDRQESTSPWEDSQSDHPEGPESPAVQIHPLGTGDLTTPRFFNYGLDMSMGSQSDVHERQPQTSPSRPPSWLQKWGEEIKESVLEAVNTQNNSLRGVLETRMMAQRIGEDEEAITPSRRGGRSRSSSVTSPAKIEEILQRLDSLKKTQGVLEKKLTHKFVADFEGHLDELRTLVSELSTKVDESLETKENNENERLEAELNQLATSRQRLEEFLSSAIPSVKSLTSDVHEMQDELGGMYSQRVSAEAKLTQTMNEYRQELMSIQKKIAKSGREHTRSPLSVASPPGKMGDETLTQHRAEILEAVQSQHLELEESISRIVDACSGLEEDLHRMEDQSEKTARNLKTRFDAANNDNAELHADVRTGFLKAEDGRTYTAAQFDSLHGLNQNLATNLSATTAEVQKIAHESRIAKEHRRDVLRHLNEDLPQNIAGIKRKIDQLDSTVENHRGLTAEGVVKTAAVADRLGRMERQIEDISQKTTKLACEDKIREVIREPMELPDEIQLLERNVDTLLSDMARVKGSLENIAHTQDRQVAEQADARSQLTEQIQGIRLPTPPPPVAVPAFPQRIEVDFTEVRRQIADHGKSMHDLVESSVREVISKQDHRGQHLGRLVQSGLMANHAASSELIGGVATEIQKTREAMMSRHSEGHALVSEQISRTRTDLRETHNTLFTEMMKQLRQAKNERHQRDSEILERLDAMDLVVSAKLNLNADKAPRTNEDSLDDLFRFVVDMKTQMKEVLHDHDVILRQVLQMFQTTVSQTFTQFLEHQRTRDGESNSKLFRLEDAMSHISEEITESKESLRRQIRAIQPPPPLEPQYHPPPPAPVTVVSGRNDEGIVELQGMVSNVLRDVRDVAQKQMVVCERLDRNRDAHLEEAQQLMLQGQRTHADTLKGGFETMERQLQSLQNAVGEVQVHTARQANRDIDRVFLPAMVQTSPETAGGSGNRSICSIVMSMLSLGICVIAAVLVLAVINKNNVPKKIRM